MKGKSYEEWLEQVHRVLREGPLWSFVTCRKALFLADLAWFDNEIIAGLVTTSEQQRNQSIAIAPATRHSPPATKKGTQNG